MTRTLLLFALGVMMLFSGSAALRSAHEQDAQPGSQPQNNNPSSSRQRDPAVGSQAPDFTLKVARGKGKMVQLSSLKGKAVLVNFWATYCGPCKIEMPWLVELQTKYGPEGLQIIGVSMDDEDEKAVDAFARKMGVNYPVLMGTEHVADLYGGIDGLPMSFFVDREGKIVDRVLGLEDESLIEASIKKSLGGEGANSASTK